MKILFAFFVAGFVFFIASNLFEIRPTKVTCSNPDLTCAFDVQGNNIVSIKRKGFPLDTFVEKRVQNNDQSEKLTVRSSVNREVKRLNLFLNLVFWVGIFSVAGLLAYTINKNRYRYENLRD